MTVLVLLLKHWRDSLLLIAAVVLLGAWHANNAAHEENGRLLERYRVADSTIAALRPQLARVDTVYRVDTMRLRVAVTHTNTLRDTLVRNIHDTTVVLRYIAAADSTLHACTDALHTCEQKQALLTEERDAWKAKALAVPTITASHSSFVSNLLWGSVGAAVGYYAGHRQR